MTITTSSLLPHHQTSLQAATFLDLRSWRQARKFVRQQQTHSGELQTSFPGSVHFAGECLTYIYSRFDASQTVTIRVGEAPNEKTFLVNASLMRRRSDFFRNALDGNWTESKKRIITFPEDSTQTFDSYLSLAYTNQAMTMEDQLDLTDDEEFRRKVQDEYAALCKIYVLAEKLQDTSARRSVLHAIYDLSDKQAPGGQYLLPNLDAIRVIYDGTTEDSPARLLIADLWTGCEGIGKDIASWYLLPQAFQRDLVRTLLDLRNGLGLGDKAHEMGILHYTAKV